MFPFSCGFVKRPIYVMIPFVFNGQSLKVKDKFIENEVQHEFTKYKTRMVWDASWGYYGRACRCAGANSGGDRLFHYRWGGPDGRALCILLYSDCSCICRRTSGYDLPSATGAMALVMVDLVADYGLQYLLAATILAGVLQIVFGVLKLSRVMKFVPRWVMVGFVNALAIMIFLPSSIISQGRHG